MPTDTAQPVASAAVAAIGRFVRGLTHADLPEAVRRQARRCVIDLAGTAAAGVATPLSRIIRDHAAAQFGAGEGMRGCRMLFDGRRVSPAGAALAGGMVIDSFDAHDGHVLTKGHAGAAILPALLAMIEATGGAPRGEEALAALVIGYEIAIRAGIATHATAPDYHTSGSWNALGVAALAARFLGLDDDRLRHALGIAEYHGPRSQMMRCIDHPTMVKDGSGVGAMVGISAAYLARDGFTGAPALVVERPDVADLWSDLGERWRILEMYFKPYPVCRWAQPAIRAALELRTAHGIDPEAVERVEIHTFHEATRLDHPAPADTESAQYSLSFPVAAALVRGTLAPGDVSGPALRDPAILAMARRIRLVEDPALSARFPAERLARAVIHLADGRTLASTDRPAKGDAEQPLSDAEIEAKFIAAAALTLDAGRARAILAAGQALEQDEAFATFLDLVLGPVDPEKERA